MPDKKTTQLKVCHGHACRGRCSEFTFDRLAAELKVDPEQGGVSKDGKYELSRCLCQGHCAKGPVLVVERGDHKTIQDYASPIEAAKVVKKGAR